MKIPPREFGLIFIFFTVTFISTSVENGYYFLLPYLEGRGVAVGTLGGVAMGVCYGVSFLVRPFIPIFEQRFGDEKMFWGGYLCLSISAACTAIFSEAILSVITWRCVFGLGLSMVGVSLTAYERKFIPEEIRGLSIALITTAYSIPSLIVVPAMEFFVSRGFYRCYIFFFPLLIAAGAAIIRRMPRFDAEERATGKNDCASPSYILMLRNPQTTLFALTATLFALTDAGQLTFVRLSSELGLAASCFFSVSAATAVFLRIFCGRLLDLLPRMAFAPTATAVTSAVMFAVTSASSSLALMLCGFVFGIGMGFGYPVLMCLILDLGGRAYVTRLAVIFGLIYSGSFFMMPVLMEFLTGVAGSAVSAYRITYGSTFLVTAMLIPICANVCRKGGGKAI